MLLRNVDFFVSFVRKKPTRNGEKRKIEKILIKNTMSGNFCFDSLFFREKCSCNSPFLPFLPIQRKGYGFDHRLLSKCAEEKKFTLAEFVTNMMYTSQGGKKVHKNILLACSHMIQ